MKLCRFETASQKPHPGLLVESGEVVDLSGEAESLGSLLERGDLIQFLKNLQRRNLPRHPLGAVRLLAPVDRQEVWAAGVTYLRSKKARMEESDFSANAYDKVYEAERPELFFKAMPDKVVGPNEAVGIRADARWNVPEPELVVVLNSRGELVGTSIGNDMSARDIEGENLLYLPQAKIYYRSCAIGPCIRVGADEAEARTWKIELSITRKGAGVFRGETSVGQLKRSFTELTSHLFRSQTFPYGAALLTGTGIVPPDSFSLEPGDRITMAISGIGELVNTVVCV